MAEHTDPSQPAESPEAEAKRMLVDTLAEQQALAALDEMIAKADSGPELSGAASSPERHDQSEAYALTGDAPPFDGWYVAMRDNAQGPFTVEDLKERWSRGEIGADSLCWREGMGEWRPLSRLHGLATAIAPRPREGLKALSSKPPPTRAVSQPGFAPIAANMLRSLAEQEAKTPAPKSPRHTQEVPAMKVAVEAQEVPTSPRPSTSPTTPEGPKRVRPPAVKPPVFAAGIPAPEPEDDEAEKRPAGLSGAKLFLSLLSASVLGGLVGGGLVRMTLPPPPAPVAAEDPSPPPPVPVVVHPPPPAPPKAEPKVEARTEPPKAEPKVEPKPKVAKPPADEPSDAQPKPPKKSPPPPPKDRLDKDFEDTFGK